MNIIKIKDNINKDIIDWTWISKQPHLIDIIELYLDSYVDWYELGYNPNAIHIIEKNMHKITFTTLASNPNAIDIIDKYIDGHIFDDVSDENDFWEDLCENPNAYKILKKNINKINWEALALNKNINNIFTNLMIDKNNLIRNYLNNLDDMSDIDISFLKFNFDEDIFIKSLSSNPYAISLIEKNLNKICFNKLSSNSNAIHIILKNEINWHSLSLNLNAIDLIDEQITNGLTHTEPEPKLPLPPFGNSYSPQMLILRAICWDNLSLNIKAVSILKKNINKINWDKLSSNINAILILEKNLDQVNWSKLSLNLNAVRIFDDFNFEDLNDIELINYLLKINFLVNNNGIYKINYNEPYFDSTKFIEKILFSRNIYIPRLKGNFLNNIFEINYDLLKKRMKSTIEEELISVMFNPKNIDKFNDWGF